MYRRRVFQILSVPFKTGPHSQHKFLPMASAIAAAFYLCFRPTQQVTMTTETPAQTAATMTPKHSTTSKFLPSDPASSATIRRLTPNITTVSLPFTRAGLISFGARATIVRLSSGVLAVFSPVPLTPAVRAAVAELSSGSKSGNLRGDEVKYIVAPDIEHHMYISEWTREFPEAHLVGPEGLPEKRAKQAPKSPHIDPGETFRTVFTAASKTASGPAGGVRISDEFDRDFDYEYVAAHPNREIAFLYRPDRVLVQADLMLNLPADEQYALVPRSERKDNLASKIFAAAGRTEGDLRWARRAMWYLISRADREGFNASVRRIAAWDFDTVIPCHGDTMVGDGRERFHRVFEWHLDGQQKKKE